MKIGKNVKKYIETKTLESEIAAVIAINDIKKIVKKQPILTRLYYKKALQEQYDSLYDRGLQNEPIYMIEGHNCALEDALAFNQRRELIKYWRK